MLGRWRRLSLSNTDSVLALVVPTRPLVLRTKLKAQSVKRDQVNTRRKKFDSIESTGLLRR